nr:DUF6233 domain-containing protein [Streptomyces swartbergensis]
MGNGRGPAEGVLHAPDCAEAPQDAPPLDLEHALDVADNSTTRLCTLWGCAQELTPTLRGSTTSTTSDPSLRSAWMLAMVTWSPLQLCWMLIGSRESGDHNGAAVRERETKRRLRGRAGRRDRLPGRACAACGLCGSCGPARPAAPFSQRCSHAMPVRRMHGRQPRFTNAHPGFRSHP